jgi:spore coat polysaccharide biosynthesis protein SpsF
MKVVAIIQARMGSTRLPGKVLADIGGGPMLWRVCRRAEQAARVDQVVVATTVEPEDEQIVARCARWQVACFRGSARDVLRRYDEAAGAFGADAVVRITADCPLIDPGVIDFVVSTFLQELPGRGQRATAVSAVPGSRGSYWRDPSRTADTAVAHPESQGFHRFHPRTMLQSLFYASNTLRRSWPRGLDVEVMTAAALARACREATQPYQRTHVTPYIYRHPELFHLLAVEGPEDLGQWRWTVDWPEDLDFVRSVYRRLAGNETFCWRDVQRLLVREPSLAELNRHARQKRLVEG